MLTISAGLRGWGSVGLAHTHGLCLGPGEHCAAGTGESLKGEHTIQAPDHSPAVEHSGQFSPARSLGKSRFSVNLAENINSVPLATICTFSDCAWDSYIFPTKQLCKQKPFQRW